MALIGTVMFSDLMTWGSWKKRDYIKDIPNPKQINTSYQKLQKQLVNMSKSIESYIVGTVINYGEEGNDNSYVLKMDNKMDNDIEIDGIVVNNEKHVLISNYGSMYYDSLSEYDIDNQVVLMNMVEKHVSKMKKKTRTNYKF